MLLSLLQLNLAPTARVSWVQLVLQAQLVAAIAEEGDTLSSAAAAALVAASTTAEADDTLTASVSAGATARISWVQLVAAASTANLAITEAGDTLSATLSTAAPATARISWVQLLASAGLNASIVEAGDTLAATATTTPANATARISWLQIGAFAGAVVDPQVAGSWTPSFLSRHFLLATPGDPTLSLVLVEAGDTLSSTAQTTLASRQLVAAIAEMADQLIAMVVDPARIQLGLAGPTTYVPEDVELLVPDDFTTMLVTEQE